jgi:hypothetical protein
MEKRTTINLYFVQDDITFYEAKITDLPEQSGSHHAPGLHLPGPGREKEMVEHGLAVLPGVPGHAAGLRSINIDVC